MSIDHILLILAIGQSGLLLIMLAATTNRRPVTGYMMGVIASFIGLFAVVLAKDFTTSVFLHRLDLFFGLLLAPMIALHAKSMTSDQRSFQRRDLKWFLPALIGLAYALGAPVSQGAGLFLMFVYLLTSLIWSIVRLIGFDGYLKSNYSSIEAYRLRWLRNAHFILAAVITIGLLQHFSEAFAAPAVSATLTRLTFLCFLGLVAFIAVKTVRMPTMALKGNQSLPARYARTNILTPEENTRLQRTLLAAMSEHGLYRQPQLHLNQLAEFVAAPGDAVTEAIRRGLGANFFDFVNQHRIEAAQRTLAEKEDSVEQIMFDVGFNSKSSFYSEFKKRTGMSPVQFRGASSEQ